MHLGTIVCSELSEIASLFTHEGAEQAHMCWKRVFPRFLYGTGLWRLSTLREIRAAEEPLAKVVPGSVNAALLNLPSPHELMAVERARAAWELAVGENRI